MSYNDQHLIEAFNRIITQYRFDVDIGKDPMTFNPTGAFATHRLVDCKSAFIMRLHRNSDDVLIDVYDFKQDDSAYKTAIDGSWIDMTGDTYFVDTWYNQNAPGKDLSQSTKTNKPTLVPNIKNGWPVVRWDGTDDWLLSGSPMNNFITPTEGVMIAAFKPEGDALPPVTIPNPYLCQAIMSDYDAFAPMTRGICTPYGPNDSVFADLYYTTEVAVAMEVLAGNWYEVVWKLHNNVLHGYRNGVLVGTVGAGTIGSDLSTVFVMGHYPWQGPRYLEGDTEQAFTFNETLSSQDIFDICLFMRLRDATELNNIKKIIKIFADRTQSNEDMFQEFFLKRYLTTAEGAQLDGIGKIVGQSRDQFDDDVYRQLIYLRIVRNMSEGTIEELITIFNTMTNPDLVQLIEQYPAAFVLIAINPDYLYDFPYIWEAIRDAKIAGVGINGLIEAVEPVFAFLDDTTGVTSGYSDVVPPAEPTTGGILASLIPSEYVAPIHPLTLSPTGAYSTHRLVGCLSDYIMRVRDVATDIEYNIYDWRKNYSQYKLSSGGAWLDATSIDFRVVKLYDQTGNDRTFTANSVSAQPTLTPNTKNGYPVIVFDGTDDWLRGDSGYTVIGNLITVSAGTVVAGVKVQGSAVTMPDIYDLPPIVEDDGRWFGITVGKKTSENDMLHAYNYDTDDDYASFEFSRDVWLVASWLHQIGNLALFVDGKFKDEEVSGDTGNSTIRVSMGHADTGSTFFTGMLTNVFFFNTGLSAANHAGLVKYIKFN